MAHSALCIIRGIDQRRCLHTGKGNFFVIEVTDDQGVSVEYEVYFDISRAKGKKAKQELFVQSAYVRNKQGRQYRHRTKRIGFFVIAHNRKVGKPIKTPR